MFNEQYEKVKFLGEGAYGCAHLIRSRGNPSVQHVAKEIRTAHLTDKQRDGALAESEVLKMMKHSNIIAYIDSFFEGPRMYIIMEYADGGDLAVKIKDKKEAGTCFEEWEIMFVFVQVALALLHIHSRKVLHRDLKPHNVFLTKQGVVKLGDFGIARILESSTAGAQTTIGTPFYLSPEMCNSEEYDKKSDLWSLGVVAYELTALRVPFHGTNLPAVALKIIGAEPDPLPSTYSSDLAWIVTELLAKEPTKRPRLENVLRMPFVQRFIKMLLSHTLEWGAGGCETMIQRAQARPQSCDDIIAQATAGGVVDDGGMGDDNGPSVESGCQHSHAGGHDLGTIEEVRTMMFARSGAGSRDDVGQSDDCEVLRGGVHSDADTLLVRERHPQADRRPVPTGRNPYDYSERLMLEFLRNREAAMMTKRRNEYHTVDQRAPSRGGGSNLSTTPKHRGHTAAVSPQDRLLEAERRKAEVRRRAQEERDEQVASRQRQLDQAMREAAEERRLLKERMNKQSSQTENQLMGAGSQEEDRMQAPDADALALATSTALVTDTVPPPATALGSDKKGTDDVFDCGADTGKQDIDASEGAREQQQHQQEEEEEEAEEDEQHQQAPESMKFCIDFSDKPKLRRKPTLSSDRRARVPLQPRGEHGGPNVQGTGSKQPRSLANRRQQSSAEIRGADRAATNPLPQPQRLPLRRSRGPPRFELVGYGGATLLDDAEQSAPRPPELRQSSSGSCSPAAFAGDQQGCRLAGAPAQWLRGRGRRAGGDHGANLMSQVHGASTPDSSVDVNDIGRGPHARTPFHQDAPPTPTGENDMSLLQDALANALCSVEGATC